MKHHFKSKESFKHKLAKELFAKWIYINPMLIYLKNIDSVHLELKLYDNETIFFVPDITCCFNENIVAFIEVIHKSPVSQHKLKRMIKYCFDNKLNDVLLVEINAEVILKQVYRPEWIKDLRPIVL